MTSDMLWSFGADVEEDGATYKVSGRLSAKRYDVEPDVSAACYFYVMNKILGTNVSVKGLMPHSMQGDATVGAQSCERKTHCHAVVAVS